MSRKSCIKMTRVFKTNISSKKKNHENIEDVGLRAAAPIGDEVL